jgi:hypothetical protein
LNVSILAYLSRIHDPKIIIPIILVIVWQYALLMQIADALAWRNPTAEYPGKLAFILNTTQPLVFFILVVIALTRLGVSLWRLCPAILALSVYSVMIIREAAKRKDYDISPPQHCRYLSYSWWDGPKYCIYMLSIILTLLALAPAWGYIVLSMVLFIGSTVASGIVAGECPSGSLWCWSIAGSGVCTFIYYMLTRRGE